MGGASLAALHDHLKLARNYAHEGLYDTSVIFFDGVVAQIDRYSLSLFFCVYETEVVKQLDAERKAFKEIPLGRRLASPPINAKSSFVFQPLDEYPASSGSPFVDSNVWRPPSRDATSRRPARGGQVGSRKSPQDGTWARGSTRTASTTRGAKSSFLSRSNSGVMTTGKKGTAGTSRKTDSAVSAVYLLYNCQLVRMVMLKMES